MLCASQRGSFAHAKRHLGAGLSRPSCQSQMQSRREARQQAAGLRPLPELTGGWRAKRRASIKFSSSAGAVSAAQSCCALDERPRRDAVGNASTKDASAPGRFERAARDGAGGGQVALRMAPSANGVHASPQFTILKAIGSGSFGTVWLADWHSAYVVVPFMQR